MKPTLDKEGFPLEWPILEADDLCRFRFIIGQRHCLGGWMNKSVGCEAHLPTMRTEEQRSNLRQHILAAASWLGAENANTGAVAPMNDHSDNSLSLLARAWNLAGALAGYVVGNPEAKTLRKMQAG